MGTDNSAMEWTLDNFYNLTLELDIPAFTQSGL